MNKYGEDLVFPGTLRGYRTWILDEYYYPHLRAMGSSEYGWEKGVNKAECIYKTKSFFKQPGMVEHENAPDATCSCGFYATHTPELAIDDPICWSPRTVFGVVEATGKILIGKNGLRAEKAKIVALSKWLTHSTLDHVPYLLPNSILRTCTEDSSYEEALRNGSLVNFRQSFFGIDSRYDYSTYLQLIDYSEVMKSFMPKFHISAFHSVIDRENTTALLGRNYSHAYIQQGKSNPYRYPVGYAIKEPEHGIAEYNKQLAGLMKVYDVPVYESLKEMVDDFPPIPLGSALTSKLSGQSS